MIRCLKAPVFLNVTPVHENSLSFVVLDSSTFFKDAKELLNHPQLDDCSLELIFIGLSSGQRRALHQMAEQCGLVHFSRNISARNRALFVSNRSYLSRCPDLFRDAIFIRNYVCLEGARIEACAGQLLNRIPKEWIDARQQRDRINLHHITLISAIEARQLSSSDGSEAADEDEDIVQEEFVAKLLSALNEAAQASPCDAWDSREMGRVEHAGNASLFVVVSWPFGELVRSKLGLGRADFHITLGFYPDDVNEGARKDVSSRIDETLGTGHSHAIMNPVTSEPDLLERCTAVLKLTLPQLNVHYKSYRQRTSAPTEFSEYVVMATARSSRSFLFDHRELAFDMLREPGVPSILRDRFVQIAPLFFPLAPRQFPERIFDVLCSVPVAGDVLFEKHITFSSFLTYIDALKLEFDEDRKLETHEALLESLRASSRLSPDSEPASDQWLVLRERLIFLSTAATLKQTLGNATGAFLVTDSTIAFQTSIQFQILRRSVMYPLHNLVQISPNQRGVFKTDYTLVLEFDIALTPSAPEDEASDATPDPSLNSESSPDSKSSSRRSSNGEALPARSVMEIAFPSEHERDFCLEYLQCLLASLELCRQTSIAIVRQCILYEAIDDVLRAQALRKTRFPCRDRKVTFYAGMSASESDHYLHMLTCQFNDIALSCPLLASLFAPAPSRSLDDPLKSKLNLGQLSDAAKTFSALIAPLEICSQMHAFIYTWQNPAISLAVISILLLLALKNWLVYLPAMLFLVNYLLLWVLADHPEIIADFYSSFLDRSEIEPANHDRKAFVEKLFGASLIGRIRSKVEDYQQSFVSAKSALESIQNGLHTANHYCMKVKGLYTWASPLRTRQFMALNALVFSMLVILPFRVIFSLIVVVHFTEHFRCESGIAHRFIDSIPLSETPRLKRS